MGKYILFVSPVIIPIVILFCLISGIQILIAYGQNTNNSDFFPEGLIHQQKEILGIVKNGNFISADTKNPLLLTDVLMQEARTPESGRIDLQHEGKSILVSHQQADGEIVWGAEIVDVAGPILSKLVERVFGFE